MQPQSITVRVSPEAARAFRTAPEDRKKIAEDLLEMLFRPRRRSSLAEFRKLAEKAHQEAVAKGLTEQKLQEILDEE
ncbi:MAG: hypothetical protein ACHQ50_16800 [Fimbriimonadales bacterium]